MPFFVGRKNLPHGRLSEVFWSRRKPEFRQDGQRWDTVMGPFPTKVAAKAGVHKCGSLNPSIKTVDSCIKIAHLYKSEINSLPDFLLLPRVN